MFWCVCGILQQERGSGGHSSPDVAGAEKRPRVEAALGLQVAAVGNKAVEAKATQGIGAEAHLRSAREQASIGARPVHDPIEADFDLRFAAVQAFSSASILGKHRRGVHRAMLKLSRACDPLSQHLRTYQPRHVAAVAGQINIALVGVLVIIMKWPDRTLPIRFIHGFDTVGKIETSGVFRQREFGEHLPREAILAANDDRLCSWARVKPADTPRCFWSTARKTS